MKHWALRMYDHKQVNYVERSIICDANHIEPSYIGCICTLYILLQNSDRNKSLVKGLHRFQQRLCFNNVLHRWVNILTMDLFRRNLANQYHLWCHQRTATNCIWQLIIQTEHMSESSKQGSFTTTTGSLIPLKLAMEVFFHPEQWLQLWRYLNVRAFSSLRHPTHHS